MAKAVSALFQGLYACGVSIETHHGTYLMLRRNELRLSTD